MRTFVSLFFGFNVSTSKETIYEKIKAKPVGFFPLILAMIRFLCVINAGILPIYVQWYNIHDNVGGRSFLLAFAWYESCLSTTVLISTVHRDLTLFLAFTFDLCEPTLVID